MAIPIKPMAINGKSTMNEIKNFVFHIKSIILMVEVMRFGLTLYGF